MSEDLKKRVLTGGDILPSVSDYDVLLGIACDSLGLSIEEGREAFDKFTYEDWRRLFFVL